MLKSTRSRIVFAACVALVYVALAVMTAATWRPRADEGFFASPALNLVTTGSMGTPVLEGAHAFMKDIHKYTYWITPLDFLAQAAWYEVFGFSLFAMRTLSIAWALVALAAWFVIIRMMSGNAVLALLAVTLIGLDYNFILIGSSGRMDMMAAALGFSGFAAYLGLREWNLQAAVLAGNALVCASGLTHPVAGYLSFSGLTFLTLYYDRRRIGIRQVAIAAIPYAVGAAGWGWYILKDPSAFIAQFTTNSTMDGRLRGLTHPWQGFWTEITGRYGLSFGLTGQRSFGHKGPVYLKSIILFAAMLGVAGAALTRDIRRGKGWRSLMLIAAMYFVLLSIFDGQKAYYYLVHIFPFYAALSAVWLYHVWQHRLIPRSAVGAALAGVLLLQTGAIAYNARLNTYARTYQPAVEFLRKTVKPGETVLGSASLGFGLNFPRNFTDDVRLGYISRRKPDYIVVNEEYYTVFLDYQRTEPAIYDFIVKRLAGEYDRIYDQSGFQVYEARTLQGSKRQGGASRAYEPAASPSGLAYP